MMLYLNKRTFVFAFPVRSRFDGIADSARARAAHSYIIFHRTYPKTNDMAAK